MFKVRFNEKSVTAKLNKALEGEEDKVKKRLKDVASDLAERAPVDTGAYAESFSVDTSGGRSMRRVSSSGRPKQQDKIAYQSQAYARMAGDIEAIEVFENNRILFKNGAPHATEVEKKYQVFGSTRDRNR